ncbi:MAG: YbaB/EbfC family nucleoid-associated protein [Candidatus Binatia bacterium]
MGEMGMIDVIKQARTLQKQLDEVQKRAERQQVTASAGGGMVEVTMNGKLHVLSVNIEAKLVAGGDVCMIQDLVRAAFNDAIGKARKMVAGEMQKVTGGLNIPGLGS